MKEAPSDVVSLSLREVAPSDSAGLDCVADLHMTLLGFGPMAGLGRNFVREICYRAHMKDGLLRVCLAEVDGSPAGFVAFTARSIGFHRAGLRRHLFHAALATLGALAQQPSRIFKLVRALKVLVSRRAETGMGQDPLGEVVCVAVRKEFLVPSFMRRTGLRLGELLVRHAAVELDGEGVGRMRMIVDADNRPVLMLYHLMGAHFEAYQQAGEPRVHVWFDLATFVPRRAGVREDV